MKPHNVQSSLVEGVSGRILGYGIAGVLLVFALVFFHLHRDKKSNLSTVESKAPAIEYNYKKTVTRSKISTAKPPSIPYPPQNPMGRPSGLTGMIISWC